LRVAAAASPRWTGTPKPCKRCARWPTWWWPTSKAGRRFGAVVVTNYLWRELMPTILASVAEGGVLIHETFATGNETVGKPSNPKFLLRQAELLALTAGLRVVAFEDGFLSEPERFVQRIVAVREPTAGQEPARYRL
jgi:hypothetical protein